MQKIKIEIDKWLKDTRMVYCMASDCESFDHRSFVCGLKEVEIGEDGKCMSYKPKKKETEDVA